MYSVQVCNDSGSQPGSTCNTLNNPATLANGFNTFTADGTGLNLSSSTTYWVVVNSVSGGRPSLGIREAASGAEDSGGTAGWNIANDSLQRLRARTTWGSPRARPYKIGIYGDVKDPALVSNTGQTTGTGGTDITIYDAAQAFTTGPNAGGYRLTDVEIEMTVSSVAIPPTYSVQVCNDSSGQPGSTCDTLNNPASLANGFNTFTADGTGIDLSKDTTYWVVVNSVSGGRPSLGILEAASGAEDSGGTAGWSIANDSLQRLRASTAWGSPRARPYKIAVHGSATPGTLVKNLNKTAVSIGSGTNTVANDAAQAFTTGAHAAGYKLTSATLGIGFGSGSNAEPTDYSVKICNDSSNAPGSTCSDLDEPEALASGDNSFTASGAGIDLSANTTYWVVFDSVSGGSGTVEVRRTLVDSEDSGGATGWGISNDGHSRGRTTTGTWTSGANAHKVGISGLVNIDLSAPTGLTATPGDTDVSLRWTDPKNTLITKYQVRRRAGSASWSAWADIASSGASTTSHKVTGLTNGTTYTFELRVVIGSANGEAASASASPAGSLVKNLNKSAVSIGSGTNIVANDAAQAFTTGTNTEGYKLNFVILGVGLASGATAPTDFSVKVCNDSSSAPGSACDTLTGPDSLAGGGADVFTASGAGLDLSASTTYWIVFDSESGGSGTVDIRRTTDDGEDTGGAAGWGIGNDGHSRARTTTGTWTSGSDPHKMGLYGYAKTDVTPPTVQSAVLFGSTLTVTFSENLRVAAPAASRFTYRVNGAAQPVADTISISESRVILTWNTAPSYTGTLTLNYSQPGDTASPLQDPTGNKAASFTGQQVSVIFDYDTDDDGLIDIDSAAKLNAVRWDLNGDGTVASGDENSYAAAFDRAAPSMGCGDTDSDNSPGPCTGYELRGDIDLDIAPYNVSPWWTPIGTYTATFEGNGNTIDNLTIDKTDTGDLGLFSILGSAAVVRNLGLTGASVTGRVSGSSNISGVGVLAGKNQGTVVAAYSIGTLACVKATGATGNCRQFGGLVGESTGEVRRSHSAVNVSGAGTIREAGGLVGNNNGTIKASFASGNVSGFDHFGGLAGVNRSTGSITASYSIGQVTGSFSGGGLVGDNTGTVTDSYYDSVTSGRSDTNRGTPKTTSELLSPTGYTGIYANWNLDLDSDNTADNPWDFGTDQEYPGLVDVKGNIHRAALDETPPTVESAAIDAAGTNLTVTFSENLKSTYVPAANRFRYRVNGSAQRTADSITLSGRQVILTWTTAVRTTGTLTVDYIKPADTANPLQDAPGNKVATFTRQAVYVDYDSDDDGLIEINTVARLNAVRWDLDGNGTPDDVDGDDEPDNVTNYDRAFARAVSGMGCPATGCTGYELTADINLNVSPYNRGRGWTPIANTTHIYNCNQNYTATFEGNGNTIANLMIAQTLGSNGAGDCLGLFGALGSSAEVRNLGLTDASVTSTTQPNLAPDYNSAANVGVLAGQNKGLVEAVYSTGTVTCAEPRNVSDGSCIRFGGLIGINSSENTAKIRRSHSSVDVSQTTAQTSGGPLGVAGGLVGVNNRTNTNPISRGTIEASYATGDVTGALELGGLVGSNGGTIIASYSIGRVSKTGTGSHVGGLIGRHDQGIVTNSYYDRETSGQSDSGANRGVGKTTAELTSPTDYNGIYQNWNLDFDTNGTDDNPWRFGTAKQYPGLVDGNGDVQRPTFPELVGVAAYGRTLALAYQEELDRRSVPARTDFTVEADDVPITVSGERFEADGVEVTVNSVRIQGNTVFLNLALTLKAGQAVRVSYTRGDRPIRNLESRNAKSLPSRSAVNQPLTVEDAFIHRDGVTVTIRLSEKNLKGSYQNNSWRYRVDNGSLKYPASGSFNAAEGTVTLTLPSKVNVANGQVGGTKVRLWYSRTGSSTMWIQDHANELLPNFSNRLLLWQNPTNGACTLGPGPDPRNPDGPCGVTPYDRPENYKSREHMTEWELTDPWPPTNVRIVDDDNTDIDCPAGATSCKIRWDRAPVSVAHLYQIYWFADLEQDPENDTVKCETSSIQVKKYPGHRHVDTLPNPPGWTSGDPVSLATLGDVSLHTPSNVPAGCRVAEWVAAVSVTADRSDKVSGSAVAFRDGAPPTARRADLDATAKTVTIDFDEALSGAAPAAAQFRLQSSTGSVLATATGVSIDGKEVTVTFASIPAGAEKIRYTAPTTNPLQDALQNKTPSFTREL